MLLMVMVTVYVGTFLYQYWRMGEPIFGEPGDIAAKRKALQRIGMALVFLPIAFTVAMEQDWRLGGFVLLIELVLLVLGVGTYLRSAAASK